MKGMLQAVSKTVTLLGGIYDDLCNEFNKVPFKSQTTTKEGKKQIDDFITNLISKYNLTCSSIYNLCTKEIANNVIPDEEYYILIKRSLDQLQEIDDPSYTSDFQIYSLDSDFKYESPIICAEVIIKNLIKMELIDRMRNMLFSNMNNYFENLNKKIQKAKTIKLETTLTVEELSYFFRLLEEAKIILVKQKTDIFRFLSESFFTKRINPISEKSLNNGYYEEDIDRYLDIQNKIMKLTHLASEHVKKNQGTK
jgi:hypothetical protein